MALKKRGRRTDGPDSELTNIKHHFFLRFEEWPNKLQYIFSIHTKNAARANTVGIQGPRTDSGNDITITQENRTARVTKTRSASEMVV